MSITWSINGTGSADNAIIKLGIVTNGAGSHNSSLTIPGYPQYNNTVVRCNAFGLVDGNSYVNFNQTSLKIQSVLVNTNVFMILSYISFLSQINCQKLKISHVVQKVTTTFIVPGLLLSLLMEYLYMVILLMSLMKEIIYNILQLVILPAGSIIPVNLVTTQSV